MEKEKDQENIADLGGDPDQTILITINKIEYVEIKNKNSGIYLCKDWNIKPRKFPRTSIYFWYLRVGEEHIFSLVWTSSLTIQLSTKISE